jgi:1-acyl-sn-glycerol-3-phosphate acyltransferase
MKEFGRIIDIEQIISKSNSKFLRSLPKFIIRLITKLVQQDEINAVINANREKSGVPFINGILNDWNVKVNVRGEANLPPSGRFVFVANHPVGGMDALSFFSTIYRHYPDVISPSNELFKYIPQLKPILLGINVFGKNTKETAEKINILFESNSQILLFPAGEVSRRNKGIISDITWQKSFITKAVQHKRDIIPVYISGRNSNLFYSVASIRKALGIRLYLETALLPREMIKQKNSTFTLSIGGPVLWQTFTIDKSHAEWAQRVKKLVYDQA